MPAADAVKHDVHTTLGRTANELEEVTSLVVNRLPAETLDDAELAGGGRPKRLYPMLSG